jgi:cell division protein ZapA
MYEREDMPREAMLQEDRSISVEIYDQVYHLRGTDPAYIEHLAQVVDAKMRAVSAHGGTVDSLRVAVLASLNIADELVCARERYNALAGSITQTQSTMRSRSASLTSMLDEVFDEVEPSVRRAG